MPSEIMTLLIVLIAIAAVFLILLSIMELKKIMNRKVPACGINESTYLNVNGTRQWINIYGKDINNPVLLYIHGGPGMSTSLFSYAVTREWADVYTIVTWDQRNCGKSYCQKMSTVELSNDTVRADAMSVIDYLRDHLHKDKITILGHSWGSMLGVRLVLEHPERFEAFIGTGQLIDLMSDEPKLFAEIRKMAKDDTKDLALIDKLEGMDEPTVEYIKIREKLLTKYGQTVDIRRSDAHLIKAVWFNPYYSTFDLDKSKYLKDCRSEDNAYPKYISSKETNDYFTLKDVKEFPIPYYNINGDRDFIADYRTAQEFFDRLEAPAKKMYLLKGAAHGTMLEKSEEFSKYMHEIAEQQRAV